MGRTGVSSGRNRWVASHGWRTMVARGLNLVNRLTLVAITWVRAAERREDREDIININHAIASANWR